MRKGRKEAGREEGGKQRGKRERAASRRSKEAQTARAWQDPTTARDHTHGHAAVRAILASSVRANTIRSINIARHIIVVSTHIVILIIFHVHLRSSMRMTIATVDIVAASAAEEANTKRVSWVLVRGGVQLPLDCPLHTRWCVCECAHTRREAWACHPRCYEASRRSASHHSDACGVRRPARRRSRGEPPHLAAVP